MKINTNPQLQGSTLLVTLMTVSACAPKAAPVALGTPKHPDFVFPVLPQGTAAAQASNIERGWQYLQFDDFKSAEREFTTALKQQPSFHPAETAMAPRSSVTVP